MNLDFNERVNKMYKEVLQALSDSYDLGYPLDEDITVETDEGTFYIKLEDVLVIDESLVRARLSTRLLYLNKKR